MKFAQTLDKTMKEKNISNYEMSKKTGISDSLIGYWRKGERVPKADNLIIIANFLECSVDYLLGRTDEPQTVSNGGSNISQKYIDGNAAASITNGNKETTSTDKMTDEFIQLFHSLDIADKIAVMNLALEKSKK